MQNFAIPLDVAQPLAPVDLRSRCHPLHRLGAMLLALVPLLGCDEAPAAPADMPIVRVVSPQQREVTDYVYFTGRLEAVESVNVQARVTGYLVSIDFEPGKAVTAGQRLFQIDPRPYQAELDRANAQLQLARARLQLAQANNARAKELGRTPGAISQQELDRYQAEENEAAAAVTAAQAEAEAASLNLSFTDVTSPIDGVVGRNLITLGNLVKQDQTLLTTVVSQDPMFAYFDIDEHTMLRAERAIRDGKVIAHDRGQLPVEFGLADEGDEYPHQGYVDFIDTQVNASTGTLQLRGVFPNPELRTGGPRLLRPGQFVRVRLPPGPPTESLLVPQAAVGSDQGTKYLLIVGAGNVVQYVPVTLGPQQPGALQVVRSVSPDGATRGSHHAPTDSPAPRSLTAESRVIVGGQQRVRPGMTVEAKPVERDPFLPAAN